MDILEKLSKLQADMPSWLEKADLLGTAAQLRYNGFNQLQGLVTAAPPVLRRNRDSTESLRPQQDGEKIPSDVPTPECESVPAVPASAQAPQSTGPATPEPAAKVGIDPRNRHLFRELREQRRKRNNPSLNGEQNGTSRARSRISMVIYYDSSIQEGFETLVRNISGARSVLRKARAAKSMRPKISNLKAEEIPAGGRASYDFHLPGIPRLGSPLGDPLTGSKTGLEVYMELDQELEAAQTLCEVGAHQALRDGDCIEEIGDVKEHFQKCQKLVDAEISELQAEERNNALLGQGQATAPLPVAAGFDTPKPSFVSLESDDPSSISVDGPIEADDGSDASIIVDLSVLPGRRQYSSKHQPQGTQSGREKSLSQPKSRRPKQDTAAASGVVVDLQDKFGEYTRAGMDVPLEAGEAIAAASVAVGSFSTEEPEIDLSALRSSVPRRRQEQAHTTTTMEDSGLDLAAMRASALKRRGPPTGVESNANNKVASGIAVVPTADHGPQMAWKENADEKLMFAAESTLKERTMPRAQAA